MGKILITDEGDIVCGPYQVTANGLLRLARRMSPNHAEDLVQAMYEDVLRRPELPRPTKARLVTRLAFVAKSQARNHHRRDYRAVPYEEDEDHREIERYDDPDYLASLEMVREAILQIECRKLRQAAMALMRYERKKDAAKALALNPATMTLRIQGLREVLNDVRI